MRTILALVVATTFGSGAALAQTAQEHAAHHPDAASAATSSVARGKASKPGALVPSSAQMAAMMESMQAMHDKMTAAKSPEERQALMAEHMKTMQEGMAMMSQMQGGMDQGTMPHAMMAKRMDMMQMMMQMMMDRQADQTPAGK